MHDALKEKMYTHWRDYSGKQNDQEYRNNDLRENIERNGIIYLNCSKDIEGKW